MNPVNTLALHPAIRDNHFAAQTNAAWFGDQNVPRRMTAAWRYFYVRTHLRTLFGRAIAGIPSGMPVPLDAGSPTLFSARPPHLAMNGGPSMSKEAVMAIAHARPEQSPIPNPSHQAGLEAAQSWFAQLKRSAADHRDTERSAFVRGLGAEDSVAALASLEFDQGFAKGLAEAFAGVRHG